MELDVYIEKHGSLVEQIAQAAEQIPSKKINWKPKSGCMGWLMLADHMAVSRKWIYISLLKGNAINLSSSIFDESKYANNGQESATRHRDSWNELVDLLMSKPVSFMSEKLLFMRGHERTVEHILWFAYEENLHHRGQLWIYARMNGLVPPTVWGTEEWGEKFPQ
jgi:uncharacterized damage-inducible protein DinB